MADKYDLVIVGTGFASSFFLHRFLHRGRPDLRVLVLERGEIATHRAQLEGARARLRREAERSFTNLSPNKSWVFLLSFGGGSNCWVACTPRMLPEDFRLRTLYGVGEDWPLSYEELEPYYCDAEEIMAISGPSDDTPFPRSRPYPQPPHRFSNVDRLFKQAYPESFFMQPTARASQATTRRPSCCGNGVCTLCPMDAKFTILNELSHLYEDPRVTLTTGARVQQVEVEGGRTATGVRYLKGGSEHTVRGELIVLGANSLFNPHILLRSGLTHPVLGKGIVTQVGKTITLHLDGVDNFGGSTYITGHGYMLYGGDHRRHHAAGLIELPQRPELRNERGKWRQIQKMRVVFEDLRQDGNAVTISAEDPRMAAVSFADGYSEYSLRGMHAMESQLEKLLAPLPIEEIFVRDSPRTAEAHNLGTTPMGDDPSRSIVDRHLIHHQVRNLVVVGGSTFPTAAPANPTLTLSALALWSADHLAGRGQLA